MINCFVINLKKDIDRKRYMISQLEELGIKYQIFDAIYAKELSLKKIEDSVDIKYINSHNDKFFTNGEIGCALSHYNVCKIIVENKILKSVIFEDDIEINKNKFLKTYNFLEHNNNWEYVSLNYDTFDKEFRIKYICNGHLNFFGKIIKNLIVLTYRPIEIFQENLGKLFGPKMFKVIRPLHLAGCYFITYEGAKKILETQGEKIKYLADYVQNEARKQNGLKLYFISPQIVKQANEKFGSNTR